MSVRKAVVSPARKAQRRPRRSDAEQHRLDLAQWVRRERPAVKFILTSGGVKAAEVAHDLCEIDPLMTKPCNLDHVVARIRALLARD